MKPVVKSLIPWIIVALIWLIGYFVTGSVAIASTIAGAILFIALMGLLYT
ncbi:hypothetical protein [Dyella sp. RRB7]|jgi:hypothetical protein|nr:hypothetical protein [Dyella sp. RRB7]